MHHGSTDSRPVLVAGLHFTYPNLNVAAALLLALATTGATSIILGLRASWRQLRAYRSLVDQIGVVEPLDKDPRVNVIADPLPQAFCAGYLRPRVYVSRRTVELLTEAELDAVLAHEHHHRRVRDPLRLAYARILSEALFFVPVLRSLSERYAELAELSADRAAVRANAGEPAPLASALLAFDESGRPGAAGISPERVDSLLGEPIHWRLPSSRLAASLGLLSGMSALVWLAQRRSLGARDVQPADSLLAALSDGDGPRPPGLRVDPRSVGAAQRGAGGTATRLARRCGRYTPLGAVNLLSGRSVMNRTRPSVPVLAVAAVVVLVSITGGTAKTTQKKVTAAPVVIIKHTSLRTLLVDARRAHVVPIQRR